MNILVANNHLEKVGGTETFTFTLIEELINRGFNVEYFTFFKGEVSDKIEKDLNVSFMSKSTYDLILANHNTCVRFLSVRGKIIQTCHGIFPKVEQPSRYADAYVAISEEVSIHLKKSNYNSITIHNGINCNRYKSINKINTKLTNVLSLTHSEEANIKIESACSVLNLNLTKLNKYTNPLWNIEDLINQSDLVVGLGRSAYEAMSCSRPVVIFDERSYFKSYSDGYMNPDLIDLCIKNNCSGRYSKKEFDSTDLVEEFKKYDNNDGQLMRDYALLNLNIEIQVDKYLKYAKTTKKRRSLGILKLVYKYQKYQIDKKKRRIERSKERYSGDLIV